MHSKTDERYGRPESGSKTERRGIKAGDYVCREVLFLLEIIDRYATTRYDDGTVAIEFGLLFQVYATYSDKVLTCCEFIAMRGEHNDDGTVTVTFGDLFALYARYTENVVGMLIRARKYGLVDFEGEMLYQRQDDHKIITMKYPLAEIRKRMKASGDPKNCITFNTE